MKIVDLFCGGGGSSTGFHNVGFETVFAVDQAWHARETFRLNHGDVVHDYDISKLRSEVILNQVGKPDIVTASPPCEPFTAANTKRVKDPFSRLFDDETGRLMLHAIRLIADLDPQFYFIENVKGILDGDGQDLLRDEIMDLGLGKPYFNWINAVEWGVPSERLRIIISNIKLDPPDVPRKTVWDAIGDLPDPRYPNEYDFHTYVNLPEKYLGDVITQAPGQGLMYFYGANKDYLNYVRLDMNKPAPVIMGKSKLIHPVQDRLLTPFEHARLMTFPDNYQYAGTLEHVYDVIGEAVPPKITEEIGKIILKNL